MTFNELLESYNPIDLKYRKRFPSDEDEIYLSDRHIGKQDINADRIYLCCYNPETGKHEGRWFTHEELFGTREKKEQKVEKAKEISYNDCSDAMLKMWMDGVLTDSEYNRIMDKLNAKHKEKNNESAEEY